MDEERKEPERLSIAVNLEILLEPLIYDVLKYNNIIVIFLTQIYIKLIFNVNILIKITISTRMLF